MELSVYARRLKQARLRAGISQEKLGVLANINEFSASARVNQYERGKHMPDFNTAERLAKALNVPTPYLYAASDALVNWILTFEDTDPKK